MTSMFPPTDTATTQPVSASDTSTGSLSLPADRFARLAALLDRECTLMDQLLFKVTAAQLLVLAGEVDLLDLIADEVDGAGRDLGAVELARGVLVADLAYQLGLEPDDVPLSQLVPYAPPDIAPPLDELGRRLGGLVTQLEIVTRRGSDALRAQVDYLRETVERIEHQASDFADGG